MTNIISRALVNDLRANVSNTSAAQAYATDAFGGAKPIPDSMLFPAPRSAGDTAVTFSLGFTGSTLRTGTNTLTEERQINLVDGLSYSFGNHQIKIGADYRRELPFYNGFNGISYTYPNITGAISNRPSSTAASRQSRVSAGLTNFSAYAQDSWKVSGRLSLTHGLRWEVNTAPHTLGGTNNFLPLVGDITNPSSLTLGTLGGELWPTKYANVALRFGLAYQLRHAPGRELVLRAGAGVFYDTGTGNSALGSFFAAYPNQVSKILPAGTGFPLTPDQAAIPSPSLTAPVAGSRFFIYPSDLQLPRTYQWNTALERSLGSAQTISASYVGAIGRKLLRGDQYGNVTSQRYIVQYTSNSGTSDYHSFQLQYQRRLSHGLAALASYTWSHSIDTASTDESFTVPATIIPARVDRGPSDFDIRHVLNAAVSYDIPALKGHAWISRILDHWGVDSIVTARSATPVTPTSFRDIGFGALFFRPDVVPGVPLYLTDPTVGGGRRFNPLAFTIPATAQGNLGRNALRGFPLSQVDLSIRRMFPMTEKLRLQFRGDLFNVLNHPNFGNPVNNLTNPLFGRSTTMANVTLGAGGLFGGLNPTFQMGGPRSMQFSLKLSF